MKRFLVPVVGAMALAGPALAQTYPEKPVTILVPAAAGGPSDTVTRIVADAMAKTLGGESVIQNMGGAGGTLGAAQVAKAPADGYTLLLTTSASPPARPSTRTCPTIRAKPSPASARLPTFL